MKFRSTLVMIIAFAACCFASDSYHVLVNPNRVQTTIETEYLQTLFILDYSNSMNERLYEKTKYGMLLESMKILLSNMSSKNKVGVRIYGQRWGITPYDSCKASTLVAPIRSDNLMNISDGLAKYKPRGMTPITYSLKQAVTKDFKGLDGDKHIILITDGGENCDESPCKYAMELVKYRKDIKIDVIAFNIDNDDDLDQLECVASVTKGKLYNADTKAKLIKSLNHAFRVKKEVDAKILY